MTETLLAVLATAALFGVTHAIEPDHVAGISSLTSHRADPRLSALVGACFSAGHVLLVLAWLAVGWLLLGRTEFPAVLDTVGTLGVVVLLGAFGLLTAVGGLRSIRAGEHEHADGTTHSHPHLHLPGLDPTDHDHTTRAYLKTGVVGALFTLSPPLSMIAFASTLLPAYGGGAIALAVVAYAVGITATMSLLGAGVGGLVGLTADRSRRAHGALQTAVGVAVVALAASMAAGVVG